MVAYGLLAKNLRYTFELVRRDCGGVSEYFSWVRLLSVGLFSLNNLRAQFWRHSELRTPKVSITLCRSLKRRDRTFFLVFPNVLTTYGGSFVPSWKAKMSYSYLVVGKELLHLA